MSEPHSHNGIDNLRVYFHDVRERTELICHTIQGTAALTASNYGVYFIAPKPCIVLQVREVHQVAGTGAGGVTVDVEKLTGTQALDSGVSVMSTAISLKLTANTVQIGAMSPTITNRRLAEGDRLAAKDTGTLTSVSNVTLITEIQYQ